MWSCAVTSLALWQLRVLCAPCVQAVATHLAPRAWRRLAAVLGCSTRRWKGVPISSGINWARVRRTKVMRVHFLQKNLKAVSSGWIWVRYFVRLECVLSWYYLLAISKAFENHYTANVYRGFPCNIYEKGCKNHRDSILLHSDLNPAWHFWLSTRPERIYNSHYGNGVSAMFTS